MDYIVPFFLLLMFGAIAMAYDKAYALLGRPGELLLTALIVVLIIAIMRYFKYGKEKKRSKYENSEYVEHALGFVSFIDETFSSATGGVYCGPNYISCYVPEYNQGGGPIGVYIRGYLYYLKEEHWSKEELKAYLKNMKPLKDYLGSSAAFERFILLDLDLDLINGDIERPLIKMPLTMPKYELERNNYIDALRSKCKSHFERKYTVLPEENLSYLR